MQAVVVFESMYGNTRLVAEAIGSGLRTTGEVVVLPVGQANSEMLDGVDLLVVGGPTHVHSLSRPRTRDSAAAAASATDSPLTLDADAEGSGVREWLDTLGPSTTRAAAFDTRIAMPVVITGRASKRIARELREHGFDLVVPAESFLVDKESRLELDEEARAKAWGERLAQTVGSTDRTVAEQDH